ncbi:zinc ABC transporter solute-binding protein [Buchnera aphidicola (Hormaphis cornu)]|nr:zinc ABC transporter solute-binding protein [Buchnera aphidicola (Hormaphis cornu)]
MFNKKLNLHKLIIIIIFLFCFITNAQAAIITTIKPLGFIIEAIANKVMNVDVLFPNKELKHHYYLKPSDINKIKKADLFIWIGPEINSKFSKLMSYLDNNKKIQLTLVNEIQPFFFQSNNKKNFENFLITDSRLKSENKIDTNLWLSPNIALNIAKLVHHKLCKIIPNKKFKIDQNLLSFQHKIIQAKNQILIKLLPFYKKKYFLLNNTNQYFEKYFGLHPTIVLLPYHSTMQLNANYLYKIQQDLSKQKNSCIFIESSYNKNIIKILLKDSNIKVGIVDLFGSQIPLTKNSYISFLFMLTKQYINCFKNT